MRRVILLLTALILLPAPRYQGQTKFTREQLREDFQVLQRALEEGHIGIYRYTDKAELDRAFAQAAHSLDRAMGGYEFYRIVAPVVAALKCGHTRVQLPDALRQELDERLLLMPLLVRVLDGKGFVLRDFSHSDHRLAGSEIKAINGVSAERIVATMLTATPGDGDIPTERQRTISGWRFATNLIALLGLRSPYELLVSRAGKTETVTLDGQTLTTLRATAQKQYPQDQPLASNSELKYLDGGTIAVMRIGQFVNVGEFLQQSFADLHAKSTRTLILDLRNNGGGMDDLGMMLVSYLVQKPFTYYRDIQLNKLSFDFLKYVAQPDPILTKMFERGPDGKYHMTGHPVWGVNQSAHPGFTGRIFALMNGGSFSSTSEVLAHLHFNRRAVFIGEEAGGAYYGNTAGFMPTIALPHTKLKVQIPLVAYYLAVSGYRAVTRGVVPDHVVKYSIAELMAGEDLEMKLALQLARQ